MLEILSRAKQSQQFSETERDLALFAKALGHPARVAILRFLATQDECFCGRIVDKLPLAQSTVSQHLRALRDAGLIQGTVDGTKVCYCLDPQTIRRLGAAFTALLSALEEAAPSGDCAC